MGMRCVAQRNAFGCWLLLSLMELLALSKYPLQDLLIWTVRQSSRLYAVCVFTLELPFPAFPCICEGVFYWEAVLEFERRRTREPNFHDPVTFQMSPL